MHDTAAPISPASAIMDIRRAPVSPAYLEVERAVTRAGRLLSHPLRGCAAIRRALEAVRRRLEAVGRALRERGLVEAGEWLRWDPICHAEHDRVCDWHGAVMTALRDDLRAN
jgi:hypothetical protein